MKQLVILLGCVVLLAAAGGCPNNGTGTNHTIDNDNNGNEEPGEGVEVIVEGGGKFPESLVGTWKNKKRYWEFVFEPDGNISSAVIDSGMLTVTPSKKVNTSVLPDGALAVYELGRWRVEYKPANRELAIEVVVDHFSVSRGDKAFEGQTTDWFVGPVSKDSKTWKPEWFIFPKYVLRTPEPQEFPFDPNSNPIDTLIFEKQ